MSQFRLYGGQMSSSSAEMGTSVSPCTQGVKSTKALERAARLTGGIASKAGPYTRPLFSST